MILKKMGSFVLALGPHQTKMCLNKVVVNVFCNKKYLLYLYSVFQTDSEAYEALGHLEKLFKQKCNFRQNMSTVSLCHSMAF